MTNRTSISPRRVAVGSLVGLTLTVPILYFHAISGSADNLDRTAATRIPDIALPAPPPGAEVVLPPDKIPAIDDPRFVPVAQAHVLATAPMIAFSHEGETHAYSLHLLNGHEIVNDTVGGEPVAVTW
jgi:uncharacterized protein DUF3179